MSTFAFGENPFIPSLGASGAISGVMGGYLVLHPHRRVTVIMLRMLTDVPGYVAVGLWFVFQLISAFGVIGRVAGRRRRCIHGAYRRLRRRRDTRQTVRRWKAGQSAVLQVVTGRIPVDS